MFSSTRPAHSCPLKQNSAFTPSLHCFKTSSVVRPHCRRLPLHHPPCASSSFSRKGPFDSNDSLEDLSARLRGEKKGDDTYDALEDSLKLIEGCNGLLKKALDEENYEQAAQLRDYIAAIEKFNPEITLNKELKAAVEAEDYVSCSMLCLLYCYCCSTAILTKKPKKPETQLLQETAATIRDKLKAIEAAKPPPPSSTTNSSLTTNGIKVECQSYYVAAQSKPKEGLHFFSYKIIITNVSNPSLVKLKSRYWLITDDNKRINEVRGPGVVGQEPELNQGESFEYMSACPLPTTKGTMEGNFEFYSYEPKLKTWNTSFLVEIARFGLNASASPPESRAYES